MLVSKEQGIPIHDQASSFAKVSTPPTTLWQSYAKAASTAVTAITSEITTPDSTLHITTSKYSCLRSRIDEILHRTETQNNRIAQEQVKLATQVNTLQAQIHSIVQNFSMLQETVTANVTSLNQLQSLNLQ